jgi:hypothetical protein
MFPMDSLEFQLERVGDCNLSQSIVRIYHSYRILHLMKLR